MAPRGVCDPVRRGGRVSFQSALSEGMRLMTLRALFRRGEAGGQRLRKLFGSTWTSLRRWRPKNGFLNP